VNVRRFDNINVWVGYMMDAQGTVFFHYVHTLYRCHHFHSVICGGSEITTAMWSEIYWL